MFTKSESHPSRSEDGLVTDVTGLYSVPVLAQICPLSITEVSDAIKCSVGPISIGGGRFSMGGQVASGDSLHLDMRGLNYVGVPKAYCDAIDERFIYSITVGAGATWKDIQRKIDPLNLAVSIMQTYANFTVGGSLSVNVHGRYVGMGALIHSVIGITVVLADGQIVKASREDNYDIFCAAIGGYGGIGVIVEATLKLSRNSKVERISKNMDLTEYHSFFGQEIVDDGKVVFHNALVYPPDYKRVRSVSWKETDRKVTQKSRLQESQGVNALKRYFTWSISELPYGAWRREHILDPLYTSRKVVHWRNYEAGYDVSELEPASRFKKTYVLQEYFVPVAQHERFIAQMGEILNEHGVNVLNLSIRHAKADLESLLSWAREEVFAVVLYYKQETDEEACQEVLKWTQKLIELALSFSGSYYLPYQPHGTLDQFRRSYPKWSEMFAAKAKYDPDNRFRNIIWDKYYL